MSLGRWDGCGWTSSFAKEEAEGAGDVTRTERDCKEGGGARPDSNILSSSAVLSTTKGSHVILAAP